MGAVDTTDKALLAVPRHLRAAVDEAWADYGRAGHRTEEVLREKYELASRLERELYFGPDSHRGKAQAALAKAAA